MLLLAASICLLVSVVAIGIGYMAIRRRAREFSQEVFGTDSLMEGFRKQEEEYASTPKSVSGMTELCLPKIKADFPEFTYSDFKVNTEKAIKLYLDALEKETTSGLKAYTSMFQEQVRLEIENNAQQNLKEDFDDIHIHRTEISDYKKRNGRMDIVLQTALEYRHRRYNRHEQIPQAKRKQVRMIST